jgi:uncharacterized membrane protein YdjX (TVP38/TMEM64 family)
VDDEFARIGSANFSRRSMGVDTECDLAVEARGRGRVREGIRRIRARLLAEHLALPVDDVAAALERDPVCALIDARAGAEHTLVPIEIPAQQEAQPSETVRAVADPGEPIAFISTPAELLPPAEGDRGRSPFLLFIPLELWVVVAGVLLGASTGIGIALAGSLAAGIIGYAIGRVLGPSRVTGWTSPRSYKSIRQLGATGMTSVIMLRLASVATAGSIHLLCGAARVPFAAYLAGTAIGLVPMVVALAGLGALVRQTLLEPSIANGLLTVGAAALIAAGASVLRTALLIRQFGPSVSSQRARAEFG